MWRFRDARVKGSACGAGGGSSTSTHRYLAINTKILDTVPNCFSGFVPLHQTFECYIYYVDNILRTLLFNITLFMSLHNRISFEGIVKFQYKGLKLSLHKQK